MLAMLSGILSLVMPLDSKTLLSPLPSPLFRFVQETAPNEKKKVILGFLPFWNIKYESSIRYHQLTDIAFFGLDVAPDGTIKTKTKDGFEEPGWTAYQSASFGAIVRKAHDRNSRIILTLRAFDNNTIESIVLNKKKQDTLIAETIEILKLKSLDGVNIDFEYVGSPPKNVRDKFTEFVQKFHADCSQLTSHCSLSIDTYADAATEHRLWDISALVPFVDHIVVMAYDFTRPSSDYSGPVAPLDQIKEAIQSFLSMVPSEKILLGVPYYGYEWPTYSKEPISKTKDVGYIATYKRIKELVTDPGSILGWDNKSFTPYVISTSSGKTSQIFYDDTRSLSLKYDFVNEANLGGIAIWALGYDSPNAELWGLLQEKFRN